MKIKLEVLGGPMDGKDFLFSEKIGIGRDKSNKIYLPYDKFISRNHALIKMKSGDCYLEDLESRNGTFIDEERVKGEVFLENKKIFRVGKTYLRISW